MTLPLFLNYCFILFNSRGYCTNPTAELVISIGIPIKEVKAEMETHPVTIEIAISE